MKTLEIRQNRPNLGTRPVCLCFDCTYTYCLNFTIKWMTVDCGKSGNGSLEYIVHVASSLFNQLGLSINFDWNHWFNKIQATEYYSINWQTVIEFWPKTVLCFVVISFLSKTLYLSRYFVILYAILIHLAYLKHILQILWPIIRVLRYRPSIFKLRNNWRNYLSGNSINYHICL